MTNFLKVTLVSLAVLAGATAAQAGQSHSSEEFTIDQYMTDLERNAG